MKMNLTFLLEMFYLNIMINIGRLPFLTHLINIEFDISKLLYTLKQRITLKYCMFIFTKRELFVLPLLARIDLASARVARSRHLKAWRRSL